MEVLLKEVDALFVNGFMQAIISYAILFVTLFVLNICINRWIKKKYGAPSRTVKLWKRNVLKVFFILGVAAQFKAFSVVATSLIASGGLLAIMVGMASQEAASNIINGAFILMYKPYRTSDYISIPSENLKGIVLEISLRHTIIETIEKTRLIIPNQIMNSVTIENVNTKEQIKGNHLIMTISYDSDIDKAISIMQQCAMQHPLFVDIRSEADKDANVDAVPVFCTNFLDSSIELRATIYTADNATGFQLLSDLRRHVKQEFDANHIDIPFPHVVIKQ